MQIRRSNRHGGAYPFDRPAACESRTCFAAQCSADASVVAASFTDMGHCLGFLFHRVQDVRLPLLQLTLTHQPANVIYAQLMHRFHIV